MQIMGESLFAGTGFAFNGGNLYMRRHHIGLNEQLSPDRVCSHDLRSLR